MMINAKDLLSAMENAQNPCPEKECAEVPRDIQVALTLVKAAEDALNVIRSQNTQLSQLRAENAHLREINHHIAEQVCAVAQGDKTAPAEKPMEGSITITTEGYIPPEVKTLLASLVQHLNAQ